MRRVAMQQIGLLLFICMGTLLRAKEQKPLQTVTRVDLSRYLGHWYEYARYPNRFEKACTANAQALYTLRSAIKIGVRNECSDQNGKPKVSEGWAKIADTRTNAKLRVTFFWPFYGDYWVIGLDPEYRWALVGEPKRRYLWVLTRTPTLDSETYREIGRLATEHGYDPSRLVRTPQHQHQQQ